MATEEQILSAGEKAAKFLGYNGLKEDQKAVLIDLVKNRDVFAILPAGYGKSLCYTSLPLIYDKLFHEEPSVVIASCYATDSNYEGAGCVNCF